MPASIFNSPKFQAFDPDTGKFLSFGKVYTFATGTNEPKPTYTSQKKETENSNPVILNAAGYADIYLDGTYKIIVKDQNDVEVFTTDPVTDAGGLSTEWVNENSPTHINSKSFSVSGDLTEIFSDRRYLKIHQDSGDIFAYVENSFFSDDKTIVTVESENTLSTSMDSVSAYVLTRAAIDAIKYKSPVYTAYSIAELKSLTPENEGQVFILSAGGRSGTFETLPAGDYSAEIAADPLEGVYVELDNGQVLKRVFSGMSPNPFWWGAAGDCVWSRGSTGVVSGKDDTLAVKAMLIYISNGESTTSVNPDPKLGGTFDIPAPYSFRVTSELGIYADNITATGDGFIALDHAGPVGLKIGEAHARLPVNINIDALNLISYQTSGTVVDIEDVILGHVAPYIENHGSASSTCNGITIHAGQFVYLKDGKISAGGIPLVIDLDNGRIFDHIYAEYNGFSGKLNGTTTDTDAVILWNFYADVSKTARNVRFTGNHLIRDTFSANSAAIAFRGYNTKGGTRLTSNYNPCYMFNTGCDNWTENVGCIIDADYNRGCINIGTWTHEPNGNGGEMFKGKSSNAVWDIGTIFLRGGIPDIGYNMQGKKNFTSSGQYISNPAVVFGPNIASADCSFANSSVSTSIVKKRFDVTVSAGLTNIDINHGLDLGNPNFRSMTPEWLTTFTLTNINNTTLRATFGTAPVSDSKIRLNLAQGQCA